MRKTLSEQDILARLFAPSSSLPRPAGKKAIVVETVAGEQGDTQREIESAILRSFSHLKALGISAEDNVVFCCENRLEFNATLLACWALNATTTLIDYRTPGKEVFEVCEKIDAKLLFTSHLLEDLSANGQTEQDISVKVLKAGDVGSVALDGSRPTIDLESLDLDRPSVALFTSGTTGAPKTALHTLRSLLNNLIDLAEPVDLEEGTIALTPLPISHIFGLTVLLVTQVLGMTTVLTDLNPVTFVKAVHKHKPQLIAALPQFYGALLKAPAGVVNLDDAKLLLTGGAPLAISLADKFERTFGKRLNNGYGSTESKLFAFNTDGPVLSVGRAVGDVVIDIVDSQGNTLSDGKYGEVRITSSTLMSCYLDNEDKTKSVLQNGHYYTGDLGRLAQGYLFVAGRNNDIITVAGVVVHAAEVEEVLRNYSQVIDVAVTAVANKRLGEVVKADVVIIDEDQAKGLKSTDPEERRASQQSLVRQFKAYCAIHLSRYKRPMIWNFLGPHDELPKTLAGKVNKKELKDSSRQINNLLT